MDTNTLTLNGRFLIHIINYSSEVASTIQISNPTVRHCKSATPYAIFKCGIVYRIRDKQSSCLVLDAAKKASHIRI